MYQETLIGYLSRLDIEDTKKNNELFKKELEDIILY